MPKHEEAPGPAKGARGSNALLGGDVRGERKPEAVSRQDRGVLTLRSIHDEAGRWQGLEVARV